MEEFLRTHADVPVLLVEMSQSAEVFLHEVWVLGEVTVEGLGKEKLTIQAVEAEIQSHVTTEISVAEMGLDVFQRVGLVSANFQVEFLR